MQKNLLKAMLPTKRAALVGRHPVQWGTVGLIWPPPASLRSHRKRNTGTQTGCVNPVGLLRGHARGSRAHTRGRLEQDPEDLREAAASSLKGHIRQFREFSSPKGRG